ncbi:MAG: hypothetical protein ACREEC_02425 [Thermoplasmata archaeon]
MLPAVVFLAVVIGVTVGEICQEIPTSTLPTNLGPAEEVRAYHGAFDTFLNAAGLAVIFLGGAVLSAVRSGSGNRPCGSSPRFPAGSS